MTCRRAGRPTAHWRAPARWCTWRGSRARPRTGRTWRPATSPSTASLLDAAARHGVTRLVLASSVHAAGDVPPGGWPVDPGDPAAPCCRYGVTKAAGELLGRDHARAHPGTSVVALRLGLVATRPRWDDEALGWSPLDALVPWVLGALRTPPGYHCVHALATVDGPERYVTGPTVAPARARAAGAPGRGRGPAVRASRPRAGLPAVAPRRRRRLMGDAARRPPASGRAVPGPRGRPARSPRGGAGEPLVAGHGAARPWWRCCTSCCTSRPTPTCSGAGTAGCRRRPRPRRAWPCRRAATRTRSPAAGTSPSPRSRGCRPPRGRWSGRTARPGRCRGPRRSSGTSPTASGSACGRGAAAPRSTSRARSSWGREPQLRCVTRVVNRGSRPHPWALGEHAVWDVAPMLATGGRIEVSGEVTTAPEQPPGSELAPGRRGAVARGGDDRTADAATCPTWARRCRGAPVWRRCGWTAARWCCAARADRR